jgi:hypothetical protein
VFSVVVILASSTYAPESAPNASILTPLQMQAREAAHKRCKTAANCFDAGAYIVTVTDIIEGDIPGYHLARLALRFENLSDGTLVLGYRSGSSFMVE